MHCALELNQVNFAYDGDEVLKGVDLSLRRGEFTALIGANGSGKSTLLRCAAAIARPTSGSVRVAGIDARRDPLEAKARLGYSLAPSALPTLLSGRECLRLFSEARRLDAIPEASLELARRLGLDASLDRSVAHYSLGTRQKLGIVLGLLGDPELLILDEPLNGLDPMSAYALKQHLLEQVQSRSTAVLLATHSLDIAERFITRAVLLNEGRIVRDWDRDALERTRTDPSNSLEQEMVRVLAQMA